MTDPRYMKPGLDFAVGKLVEECGELQAALGKTLRWGWHSYNPELPESERVTNEAWVEAEMDDVEKAMQNLRDELMHARGKASREALTEMVRAALGGSNEKT